MPILPVAPRAITPTIQIGAKVKVTIDGVEYEGVIVHGRVVDPKDPDARRYRGDLNGVRMEATIQIADAPPDERRQHPPVGFDP